MDTKTWNGYKLKGFRIQNDLTLADITRMIHKSPSTISRYEDGIVSMPSKVIDFLNSRFNLELEYEKSYKLRQHKIAVDFSKKLLNIRKKLGMTQKQFAKKIKCAPSHVFRLENALTTSLTVETLRALMRAGVDIQELLK